MDERNHEKCPKCGNRLFGIPIAKYSGTGYKLIGELNLFCPKTNCDFEKDIAWRHKQENGETN